MKMRYEWNVTILKWWQENFSKEERQGEWKWGQESDNAVQNISVEAKY